MSHAIGSKEAQAALIDPFNSPEPSEETGPGAHFGSTFTKTKQLDEDNVPGFNKNPYRKESLKHSPPTKTGVSSSVRSTSGSNEQFPNYRDEAFGGFESTSRRERAASHGTHTPPSYRDATSSSAGPSSRPRRGSSLRERYPGDHSHQPLDVIRRDSRKAARSPHLKKQSLPGADMIDRLDPAIGGRAYHHEGPYDAALLARNRDQKTAPLAALDESNREALKATPRENIRDAVERHKPLDGVAFVPPGVPDQFGRTYNYEEGADLMHEGSSGDAGYKRWPGKDYDPDDLKGESEPAFSLDRALKAHKIDDNGIEMEDRAHLRNDYHDAERRGKLDPRDPVTIAGDDSKYADLQFENGAEDGNMGGPNHSTIGSIKKRIGSLRHRKAHHEE